jgi:hypothetical protein
MKLNSSLFCLIALPSIAILIGAPDGSAAPPQACTKCPVSTIISYPYDAPPCYGGTTLTIQDVADGVCNSGCSPTWRCEYSISIQMNAEQGQTCGAMYIGYPSIEVANSCAAYASTACASCSSLGWTQTSDPETVRCDASDSYSDCFEMRVCNGAWPCGNDLVTKVEFKCEPCQ